MIELFLFAIISFFVALAISSIWFLICNERTYRDRRRFSSWIFDPRVSTAKQIERLRWYKNVSYEEHLLSRMVLRDPMLLYGERPE